MPNEPAISEDFERYDDAQELRRLIRAVKFAQKHYLYFVCCNQVPKQNELIDEIKKSLAGKKIKIVKFKKPVTDLLTELQKKPVDDKCEAIFVQGLEYSISSDGQGAENALIHNLNISRDSFKKYLKCPLFLWLPEYALVKITRHAPDFFSVRSGTFYFSNPPEKITEQILQSVSSSWLENSSLSLAEKLKQIKTLENLLTEYKGLHKENQDKDTEARLLSKLGSFFYSISDYRRAIEYHKKDLAISKEIGDLSGESVNLSNLGVVYDSLGDYRKGIDYYEQSLAIDRKIGDRLGEGISLGSLGVAYSRLGNYRKAIEYHKQSLAISKEIGDRSGESSNLGNLGVAYYNLGEYRNAIEYHEQQLLISRETGDCLGEANSLSNIGNAYYSLVEYHEAINYNMQSLAIFREIGNRSGEGSSLGNLGVTYNKLGEYRKAIEYHMQQLLISREIGDRLGEGISLRNLGSAYNHLGKRKKACEFWRESLTMFEKIESPKASIVRKQILENCGD